MDARVVRLHLESVGQGPPLVLLHGWALHGGLFAPVVPALSKRYRVHAVDLPGHGHSDPIRPWTLDSVAASLERAFAGEPAPLTVLGWSLGGALAMHWALAYPSRIAKLALVAATPKFVASDDWPHAMARETLDRFADELSVAWKPTLQRFLSLQVQGSEEGRATLAGLRHQLFARGPPDATALDEALATLRSIDLRHRVASITQPALVIAGERDTLAPPAASAWLARALPAGELFTMQGAAHAPFLSHRDAFVAALLEFLRRG